MITVLAVISEERLTKSLVFPLQHRLRALRRRSLPGSRWSASSRVPPGRPLKSDKETLKALSAPELGGRKALPCIEPSLDKWDGL